ncbi:other/FunK1 protein kinase [Coprinopsis cinerea okayama7|uniref:Other/FunK1 protein kinase n=1 Tax=Coprinopsis cinerea (strain Okayama-7 / 130 / ATCC MYA-4618 / FGSC 9003) TaxID=240176 RepID=A8NB04_COPC7|nr:other/FunK1 protein kinase [Coprinopsis cinerea okayama7\|eukprot:XP_001832006.2 other/FunK1 protein kinase [Coprinopsis cinerea okayama7\
MNADISTCKSEDFLENYLPDHEIEFNTVIQDLKKQGMLVARPWSLKQVESSPAKRPPFTHTFKSFKTVFLSRTTNSTRVMKTLQTIGNAVRKALGRATNCEVNDCSIRVEGNRGCITSNLDSTLHPTDVVVPMAAIPDDSDDHPSSSQETRRLLTWGSDILDEDARRRFCFALTVERTEVTLWRLSRSYIMKSTPFDMTQHADLLIRMFVAFFCARSPQLGYDPLVTLLPDMSYVYELSSHSPEFPPVYYKTTTLLWDHCPPLATGRHLRIWEVEQVCSPSDPTRVQGTTLKALKDVSVDADARLEPDVQDELFNDIVELASDDNWRLRPILKDFPQSDIDSLAEALEDGNFKQFFSCISAKHFGEPDSTFPASTIPLKRSQSNTSRQPRRRCFFIYEHVCTPLHDVKTLGEAVDIIKQSLIPLRLMFCAGWIHRDISAGNILAVRSSPDAPWRVKLADLEFACRFPGPTESKGKFTGTPQFMASEMLDGECILPTFVGGDEDEDEEAPSDPSVPAVHNYQHDLESLWWILLWLATTRINQDLPKRFGQIYFQQRVDSPYASTRLQLFLQPLIRARDLQESLPESLQSSFITSLDRLRYDLYAGYVRRNRSSRQADSGAYSRVLTKPFAQFFEALEGSRDEWAGLELIGEGDSSESGSVDSKEGDVHPEASAAPVSLPPIPPPSRKRRVADSEQTQQPSKRARMSQAAVPPKRNGPITRSMTRNVGRVTRSMTRRLQKEK